MSFLFVDDEFWMNRKVVAVLSADPRPDRGTARFVAISTWVLMGSYCARVRDSDGTFTLTQACRVSFCDARRMRQALNLLVEHRLMIDDGGDVFRFANWHEWRRPKRRGDPTPEAAEQTPSAGRGQAEHEPRSSQAQAEQTPSTSRARAEHEPTVLNESEHLADASHARARSVSISNSISITETREREHAREAPTPMGHSVEEPPLPDPPPGTEASEPAGVAVHRAYVAELAKRTARHDTLTADKLTAARVAAAELEATAKLRGTTVEALLAASLARWFDEPYAKSRGYPFGTWAKQAAQHAVAADEAGPGGFRACPPASAFRDDDSALVAWEKRGRPRGAAAPTSHAEFERIAREMEAAGGTQL